MLWVGMLLVWCSLPDGGGDTNRKPAAPEPFFSRLPPPSVHALCDDVGRVDSLHEARARADI
jgi:hypothetical protein